MSVLTSSTLDPPPARPAAPSLSPRRRPGLKLLALSATTAAAWHFAAAPVPQPAERFYALLPPATLAWLAVLMPGGVRPYLRRAAGYVAVLGAVVAVGFVLLPYTMAPGLAGLLSVARPGEALVSAYFLGSVSLVVFLVLAGLRWLGRRLDVRLHGPCPADPPRRRVVLRNDLPVLLLLPLCPPYLLAVSYAHRGKAPNFEDPRAVLGRPCEDVSFTAADGVALRGWFVPAPRRSSARTLLVCHGLGASRSFVLGYCPLADALEANLLVFDFRGHGDSDGHTITYGCREKLDVLAAVHYLRTRRPGQAREVVGLGTSLGAASLALAAAEAEPPLDAVILDSSFAVAVELTEDILRHVPTPLRRYLQATAVPLASLHAGCDLRGARPVDVIDQLQAPVLFIHAADDRLIPADHSRRLYDRAAGPKELWVTDTGGHCSGWAAQQEYGRRCKELMGKRPLP